MNAHTTSTPVIPTESNHTRTLQRCDGVNPKAWAKTGVFAGGKWLPCFDMVFTDDCTEDELLAVMRAARLQALADVDSTNNGAPVGIFSSDDAQPKVRLHRKCMGGRYVAECEGGSHD